MLPVDIMNLIDNYNEHDKGFFFCFHDGVYWFNGKRYEKYCKKPYWFYGHYNILNIDIYQSLKNKKLEFKKTIQYEANLIRPLFPFYYKNTVYMFDNLHNRKYDFQTKTWSEFANLKLGSLTHFCVLNDLFYFINYNGMFIYNPNLDLWQTIDLGCYLSIL